MPTVLQPGGGDFRPWVRSDGQIRLPDWPKRRRLAGRRVARLGGPGGTLGTLELVLSSVLSCAGRLGLGESQCSTLLAQKAVWVWREIEEGKERLGWPCAAGALRQGRGRNRAEVGAWTDSRASWSWSQIRSRRMERVGRWERVAAGRCRGRQFSLADGGGRMQMEWMQRERTRAGCQNQQDTRDGGWWRWAASRSERRPEL